MKTYLVVSVALVVLAFPMTVVVTASAQARGVGPEATEKFEVATVRQNKSGDDGPAFMGRPGRFEAESATLQELIMYAYDLQAFEIFGGPSWATSDRFDIEATMASSASQPRDQGPRQRRLLRALLAERFKLVVHEERREMPVYSLVLARTDRALGGQLRPFKGECGDPSKLGPPPEATFPLPASDASSGPQQCIAFSGRGRISARGVTLSDLTRILAPFPAVRRRVIDRTGLTGQFDFDVQWTPMVTPAGVPIDPLPAGPNLFTALQEQLGLKLEATKEVVCVLVIDGVSQPSEN